jgi:hypothetical protein
VREQRLFLLGLGLVVLHILDAEFLQPEPGTSASDHLASGLVPVGIAVSTAIIYPRLRAGLRASICLLYGIVGFASCVATSAYHTVAEGPAGDDYTGIVAAAGGALLIAVGVWTLWRTRKLGKSRSRRYGRRALIALAGLVVCYEVVFGLVLAVVVTHKARVSVDAADFVRPHEHVSLETANGLTLEGWYVPSRNGAAVIAFPGRHGPGPHARMLARHGYGVLLLDRRGEGESEGDPNGLGWGGVPDLTAAVEFLRSKGIDPARIGGLGLSVGGELMLEAAAGPSGPRAVLSEGAGIRSVREAVLPGAGMLSLPQWAVITAATAVLANRGPPPALDDVVGEVAPRPVFLVFAGNGQGGEQLNPRYFAAAGDPKALWKIEGAEHTGGLDAEPQEYERRVVAFFDRALSGG